MKLLIFIFTMSSGGAERATSILANQLVENGINVTIVTMTNYQNDFYILSSQIKRVSLNLEIRSSNYLFAFINNIRRIIKLRKIIMVEKPNITLGMMTSANILLLLSSLGICGVIGSERVYPLKYPMNSIWQTLRKYLYYYLNVLVVQTSKSSHWFKHNTYARNITIIPNMCAERLDSFGINIDPDLIWPSDINVLLGVGRLHYQKGFKDLIKAFSNIALTNKGWNLYILGEGEERSQLQNLISLNNMNDRIFLIGNVGNIDDWYKRANLFVLSSYYEGFPNSLIEAMSYGLPVISYSCDTGPQDIISDGIDGFLVPTGDVVLLQKAIFKCINDPSLRYKLANNALRVKEKYSYKKIILKWLEVIN